MSFLTVYRTARLSLTSGALHQSDQYYHKYTYTINIIMNLTIYVILTIYLFYNLKIFDYTIINKNSLYIHAYV